jgi:hypothetical protein
VDRLTALIAIAHLKLRLEILTRYPDSLEAIIMADKPSLYIPRPLDLAGMRSRLMRSQQQGKDLAKTGKAYDDVMDGIDEAHAAIKGHVGDLTLLEGSLRNQIMSMLERSNGDPTDGESDGRQSSSGDDKTKQGAKADITAVAVPAITPDATKGPADATKATDDATGAAQATADALPQLTVNGVEKA